MRFPFVIRRLILGFAAVAAAAMPFSSVRAETEAAASVATLQVYENYLQNAAERGEMQLVVDVYTVHDGLVKYVKDVQRLFELGRSTNNLPIKEYAAPGADSDYEEGVTGWAVQCEEAAAQVTELRKLAEEYVTLAGKNGISGDIKSKINEEAGRLPAAAQDMIAGGAGYSIHTLCARAVADMYYAFRNAGGGGGALECAANEIAELNSLPGPDPDGDGMPNGCQRRDPGTITLGRLPECTSNCDNRIRVRTGGSDQYYPYLSSRDAARNAVETYKRSVATARQKYEVTAGLAGEQEHAAAVAEAARDAGARAELERGSAFALPLPFGNLSVPGAIGQLISQLMGIIGAVALLIFVVAGFRWMLARGNADEIKKAKAMMVWASLGLIVIFSAYSIVAFLIENFA